MPTFFLSTPGRVRARVPSIVKFLIENPDNPANNAELDKPLPPVKPAVLRGFRAVNTSSDATLWVELITNPTGELPENGLPVVLLHDKNSEPVAGVRFDVSRRPFEGGSFAFCCPVPPGASWDVMALLPESGVYVPAGQTLGISVRVEPAEPFSLPAGVVGEAVPHSLPLPRTRQMKAIPSHKGDDDGPQRIGPPTIDGTEIELVPMTPEIAQSLGEQLAAFSAKQSASAEPLPPWLSTPAPKPPAAPMPTPPPNTTAVPAPTLFPTPPPVNPAGMCHPVMPAADLTFILLLSQEGDDDPPGPHDQGARQGRKDPPVRQRKKAAG